MKTIRLILATPFELGAGSNPLGYKIDMIPHLKLSLWGAKCITSIALETIKNTLILKL